MHFLANLLIGRHFFQRALLFNLIYELVEGQGPYLAMHLLVETVQLLLHQCYDSLPVVRSDATPLDLLKALTVILSAAHGFLLGRCLFRLHIDFLPVSGTIDVQSSFKFCLLCRSGKVVLCSDELTNFSDASLFDFLLLLDTVEQVFTEGRLDEDVKIFRIDKTSHHLATHLLDIVALATEINCLGHVEGASVQRVEVLILHLLLLLSHTLGDGRSCSDLLLLLCGIVASRYALILGEDGLVSGQGAPVHRVGHGRSLHHQCIVGVLGMGS